MKADLNQASKDGATPALMPAATGHIQSLKLLVKIEADLNQPDKKGYTAAMIPAGEGQTESLKVLAESKADLNQPDNDGFTPALLSANKGRAGALQVLVDAAADVNTTMTTAPCHSPSTIAVLMGQMPLYKLLLATGADTAYKALLKLEQSFKTVGGTAERILQERAHKT